MALWTGGTVDFTVELALGVSETDALYGTGEYGTAQYGLIESTWYDVTAYTIEVSTTRGAERFDDRMRTGQAVVLFDNATGRFNPDHGAESLPGSLELAPGRFIRVTGTVNSTDYVLFHGYIDTIDEIYVADDVVTRVLAYDLAGMMALAVDTTMAGEGDGETTGARVTRAVEAFGWAEQDIDTGDHTMQPVRAGVNLLRLAHQAAAAEGSVFYFEGDTATFRDSDWPAATTVTLEVGWKQLSNGDTWTSPEGHTVTANGDIQIYGTGDVEVLAADSEWSAQHIRNDLQLARDGGTVYRLNDPLSIVRYGRRTWRFLDYQLDNDTDLETLADKILAAYSYDYQRLAAVTVHPHNATGAEAVLDTTIGDLVSVYMDIGFGGWDYTVEAHVLGVEYTINANDWQATYRLDQSQREGMT